MTGGFKAFVSGFRSASVISAATVAQAAANLVSTDWGKRMNQIQHQLTEAEADLAKASEHYRTAALQAADPEDPNSAANSAALEKARKEADRARQRVDDLKAALVAAEVEIQKEQMAQGEAERLRKLAVLERECGAVRIHAQDFDAYLSKLAEAVAGMKAHCTAIHRATDSSAALDAAARPLAYAFNQLRDRLQKEFRVSEHHSVFDAPVIDHVSPSDFVARVAGLQKR